MALLAARRSARWGNVGDQEADGLTDGRTKIPRRGRIEVGLGLHCHGGWSDGLFFHILGV